jgi:hypothetical protein
MLPFQVLFAFSLPQEELALHSLVVLFVISHKFINIFVLHSYKNNVKGQANYWSDKACLTLKALYNLAFIYSLALFSTALYVNDLY